jgi:hypothetical protein
MNAVQRVYSKVRRFTFCEIGSHRPAPTDECRTITSVDLGTVVLSKCKDCDTDLIPSGARP